MSNLVSIIIVNYNNRQDIHRALTSLRQNNPDLYCEIIIVDNNSEDGSPQFIKENFPDIVLIENKENVGFGRANNQAVQHAKGEYLVFMNPDARILEGKVVDMVEFMETHSRVGFLGPKTVWPDGQRQISAAEFLGLGAAFGHHLHLNVFFPPWFKKLLLPFGIFLGKSARSHLFVYRDVKEPQKVDWLGGAFLMVRRKTFEDLGGFDEDYFLYFEDQDLALRGDKLGWQSYYFPGFIVEHSVGGSAKNNPRVLVERYRSELLFWIKHYQRWSLLILRMMMGLDFVFRWMLTTSKGKKAAYGKILRYVVSPKSYIIRTRTV